MSTVAHQIDFDELINRNMPRLQMLPAVAIEALELIKQPECPVSKLSTLVERDVTLASTMLKIANSPAYALGKQISSLQNAVVRLGFRECKNLIMSSCVSTLTKNLTFEEEWIRDLLWRHSLYTASIAHHINQRFHCGFQGEEFTSGLLHDLGRFLFASLFSKEFLNVDSLNFDERHFSETDEIEQLRISHTRFAETYARINNLPEELIAVMRWHHSPEQSGEHKKLVCLVAVADDMANHLQRTGDSENYDSTSNPAVALLRECHDSPELRYFSDIAASLISDAADDMHSMNAI